MKHWTEKETNTLIYLSKKGRSSAYIGTRIHKSPRAVIQKRRRIGLEGYKEFHSDKLTVSEAAVLVGVSHNTLRRWMDLDLIPSEKRDAILFIQLDSLKEFMVNNPTKWMASRADSFYFSDMEIFQKKLEEEKNNVYRCSSKMIMTDWSPAEISTCKKMVVQGYTIKEIADKVGRTETATSKFVNRNKLRSKEVNEWFGKV